MKKDFEMTQQDLQLLLDAMTPLPMIMLQCGSPPSQQERANAAWSVLGKRMHFDPMTVKPNGKGDRYFSAESLKPKAVKDGDQWCAVWPDFIDLQISGAGFGDTPELAIAELQGAKHVG